MPYLDPGSDVSRIIDAPPRPVAVLAPGGRHAALLHVEAHPPVALLARPNLALAGIRIDPVIAGRQRVQRITGLSVLSLPGGPLAPVPTPAGASLSLPAWAPDGRRLALTVDEADGIGVWIVDVTVPAASQVPGLRVRDVLGGDPAAAGGTVRWSRDGASLLALGAPPGPPELPGPRIEPGTEDAAGRHSQMPTYQDLLRTAADADLFEALATTVPVRADPAAGVTAELGPPGLYQRLQESPDGAHLLVHRLVRPFSLRVPFPYFARRAEVWQAAGGLRRIVADLPVSDEVPRQGVPTGPRGVSWAEREPGALLWAEALDGGDPVAPAEHRDRLMRLAAPFSAEPEQIRLIRHRCTGWLSTADRGRVLLTEHDRDRRWLTTWLCDLTAADGDRVLSDRSADDAYGDPGSPLMTLNADGTRTTLQDGSAIYLRGDGATPDGDRPFLDRLDLAGLTTTRLLRSPPGAYHRVVGFVGGGRDELLTWQESQNEPPNLFLARLDGSAARQLTWWPDPHPRLTGMTKRLITHDRGDGVRLSGMLYLPPGHDAARDGRLPLVIWAYPLDYGGADTAGQVRGSTERFSWLDARDPAWFVLRGCAVLADATMPVIGDPETKNDSYLEQITAAAAAHIRVLDAMGVIDPARVAVGGHSYGGFMTVNLLAHTDLFAAGIARSGAYNRSLTPFGFQTERRSFWEATAVYDRLSPFRFADKITAPLLLIHGERDSNPGTYPDQSRRLFQAVQATGGTARLVLLPHEDHAYRARESVLHMLAEQFGWVERWLGTPSVAAGVGPGAAASTGSGAPGAAAGAGSGAPGAAAGAGTGLPRG